MMDKNLLIIISGPSGVGKGTVIAELKKSINFTKSVSCTTRLPRPGEMHGREYFFITRKEFEEKIADNGFLEYSEHFGNLYGTPAEFVKKTLTEKDIVLEIDVNGALAIKKAFPQSVLIMLAPPDFIKLKERLGHRNTETPEAVVLRGERAAFELSYYKGYDYTVINSDVKQAVCDLKSIIRAEKLRSINMSEKMNKILEDIT